MNETIKPEINSKPFTLLDIILIFLKYRTKIFIFTAIVCIISIILYFFVFDLIYTSTASVKSTSTGGGILGGLDMSIPDVGGLDDIGLGTSKSAKELAAYEQILTSRKCIEPLVQKFGLMDRYESRFLEDAVKEFTDKRMKISTERIAGVMNISVEDKDPVLARDMVGFLIEQLDKINIELNIQSAKSNREFIERRFYLAKDDLAKAEDSLKSFQLIYGVAPDLQIKAAAQSIFGMEAELKSEEVKLDVLKKILSSDEPEVKTQESKVNALKSKISEMSTSTDLNDFLHLGNSPVIALQYLRLSREVEIQTKVLTFLLPLYEKAKIDEKRDTPTIIVLDMPNVAERKTKPKRLTMVLFLTLLSFGGFTAFYVIKYKYSLFREKVAVLKQI